MEKGWLFPGFLLSFSLMFSLLCEGTGTDPDCKCAGVVEVGVSGGELLLPRAETPRWLCGERKQHTWKAEP